MEENKYYTPDISEFHVGFEYEELEDISDLDPIWHNRILIPDGLSQIGHDLFCSKIRVKYLNREDIEELGWKFSKLYTKHSNNLCFYKNTKINSYRLEMLKKNNFIKIYGEKIGSSGVFFLGIIKNKSELKKLMQQIGI